MQNLSFEKQKLLNAIVEADRGLAIDVVLNWANTTSYHDAFTNLFEPVLDTIGRMWFAEKLSLAQGYLAGKVAEDIFIEALKNEPFKNTLNTKGNVVLGNIEDDFHSLGRKLVGIFLRSAGWNVHDLGNDVLPNDFVDKAIETKSKVIGVSAMMYTTAINIKKLRKEIDNRELKGKIQLAVGGAVFKLQSELVEEVGGDGTCDNALDSPALFERLHQKSINHL